MILEPRIQVQVLKLPVVILRELTSNRQSIAGHKAHSRITLGQCLTRSI